MAKLNIDDEIESVDNCILLLESLIRETNVNMLDDSAGTLTTLKSKLETAKEALDTARSKLSTNNSTLRNNTNSTDWYLKYNSYNG